MNRAVAELYAPDIITLATKPDTKRIPFKREVFDAAVRRLVEEGQFTAEMLAEPQARKLIEETYNALNDAIDSAIKHETPEEMTYALRNNAFIFSGFKTYRTLSEVGLELTDAQGNLKPYEKVLQDVRRIDEKYNGAYLFAEYNHAVHTTQMAVKWQGFVRDGDEYNLQYRTANDERVRETHAALDGVTLPPSDKFWDNYLPPNGWNCRCQVVQVLREDFPLSDSDDAVKKGDASTSTLKQQMFRFNAGKTLELFPPKHPYYKIPAADKKTVEKVTADAIREKRIADMIAELPKYLTAEEKQAIAEHNLKLESAYGITKGAAMDYDAANKGKENPNYGKGGNGYYVNCQTCTVTHYLRRLGFNVEAKPNIQGSAYRELRAQGITWEQRFINLNGSNVDYDYTFKWQRRKGYKVMTDSRLNEYLSEKFNHDGIYEVYCEWKRGSAHVFCAEIIDGNVRYFDPQSGDSDVKKYLPRMKASRVCVVRIDNKLVNPKLKNLFVL